MHPTIYYDTLRRGREELLRQAEQERLARQVVYGRWWHRLFHVEPQRKLELKHVKGS
jgi:hypothetical protein